MSVRHETAGADVQRALFTVSAGKRVSLSIDVAVTSRGLLAIGALVSSILLSAAVIVHVSAGRLPEA